MDHSQPNPISAFYQLILECEDIYDLLDKELRPSPYSIIEEIKSLLDANSAMENPSATLETIKGMIKEFMDRDFARESLDSLKKGEDEWDVLEIIERAKDNGGDLSDFIPAMGACEEPFDIEIRQVGSLFFIRANEFDDIAWFASKDAAIQYAKEEFSSEIKAYEEYDSYEYDEDSEEEDEEQRD
jgi:hypothetical protein